MEYLLAELQLLGRLGSLDFLNQLGMRKIAMPVGPQAIDVLNDGLPAPKEGVFSCGKCLNTFGCTGTLNLEHVAFRPLWPVELLPV